MILKSFELDKINFSKFKLFVLYGENEGLKKEIIWESINYNDLKKCKKINFEENNYIINTYLNLKLMNVTKSSKDLRVCKLTLEQNKFKFINEQ